MHLRWAARSFAPMLSLVATRGSVEASKPRAYPSLDITGVLCLLRWAGSACVRVREKGASVERLETGGREEQ